MTMKECTYGATPLELLINRPVRLLALHGRDGEDDGAKPEDDAESQDGAKPDDDKQDKGKDGDKPKGETETVETLTRKLANAEEARNRAVDKRDEHAETIKELNAKIAKMEKDGSPDESIKQENEQLKATNATLVSTNQTLRLEIALRDDTAHDWVKPSQVLKLVDLSDVDFDAKTGEPRGLKAALDKLAKDSPNLLKPKSTEDEGEQKPGSTGKPPAPRGKTTDAQKAAADAALRAKYPALRRG
jgi:hypothetical protein